MVYCGVLFDVFIHLYLVCYHKELQLNFIVQLCNGNKVLKKKKKKQLELKIRLMEMQQFR